MIIKKYVYIYKRDLTQIVFYNIINANKCSHEEYGTISSALLDQ